MSLWRRFRRWLSRVWRPAPPFEPCLPWKVEWTDERLRPTAVTLVGGCAFEGWVQVDRPQCLQVWDALLIDKEMVNVVAFEDDRVLVRRAIGGTAISPHRMGAIVNILGPVLPEPSTFYVPPFQGEEGSR